MATYHLEVIVLHIDDNEDLPDGRVVYDDVMKGKQMPIEGAKELSAIISQGGFLKEHKGAIATADDNEFTFYPAHRILQINIVPEVILIS